MRSHRFVPDSKAPQPRRIDPVGQLLVVMMLASLTDAIIEVPWTAGPRRGSLAFRGCDPAAAAVTVHGLKRVNPVIDPRIFKSAPSTAAAIIAIGFTAALTESLFLTTLYLQDVRGPPHWQL